MSEMEIYFFIRKIMNETGIDVSIASRKRETFYTRVVFFKIIKEINPKIGLIKLAKMVGKNHTAVIYSLNSYELLKKYSDFREIESKIRAISVPKIIVNGIYCNPIVYQYGKV